MIFNSDPGLYRERLLKDGYVHLKGILSEPFVKYIKNFYRQAMDEAAIETAEWRITGKKRQFVFEFPSDADALEFRAGIARLTGMDEKKVTFSERHLKVYENSANPWPAPHKDRAASTYSIGLPVDLPKGSSVCVFPKMGAGPNLEERAVFIKDGDRTDFSELYKTDDAVILNEQVGDIVVFLGSALYHERVNAGGTAVLYIKMNDDGRDPLGENLFSRMPEKVEM